MVKFFRFLLVMAAIVTAFGSCQKEEPVLIDEQPQAVVKPDVYVENGYLVFKSQEYFDSTLAVLQNTNDDEYQLWEQSLGFTSANTFLLNAENLYFEAKTEDIRLELRGKYSKYINKNDEFELPFYSKALGKLLNIEGVVKIGTSLYFFTKSTEYIVLDGNTKALRELKDTPRQEKSATKNIVVFDPYKNNLKSAEGQEFLVSGLLYNSTGSRRLNYSLERVLFTYVHSVNPYTGTVNYAVGYKFFLRLKQYKYSRRKYRSMRASYDVKNQSTHWEGLLDGSVVEEFNGTVSDRYFGTTRNSVYVYYASRSWISLNPNVSDLIVYSYTSKFKSSGIPTYKTISYQD